MENTVIRFRTKHDLEFKVIKHRAASLRILLRANGYTPFIIFEEQVAVVKVFNVTICTAVSIRNLIKYYKIYD